MIPLEQTTDERPRVHTGELHRVRRGHGKGFAAEAPAPQPETIAGPAHVAIMLALAHKIQVAIDRGEVKDRAEVARRLGMTRARVTQILDLTLLAPNIQERVLACDSPERSRSITERALRQIAGEESWCLQRICGRTFGL